MKIRHKDLKPKFDVYLKLTPTEKYVSVEHGAKVPKSYIHIGSASTQAKAEKLVRENILKRAGIK